MIDKIKKKHLCLGCGLCASVIGHDKCRMELSPDGFYKPILNESVDDSFVKKLCPGLKVHGKYGGELWGRHLDVVESWACDEDIRYHSSSGGTTSALAICLLEEHEVDAVLQVGVAEDNCLWNEMKVSRCRADIVRNAQSRYAPALTLYNLRQLLDNNNDTYAYIGKPCDIAGVKNFLEMFPQYKERIKLFISIFCAGMPSFEGSKKAFSLSGKNTRPSSLKYRGDGWPGYFKAVWDDGTEFRLSYNESWGKILGHFANFRCKVCADGTGSLADVSIGDSWRTKDGYPDFEEQDGRSLVFYRTKKGRDAMKVAEAKGYVTIHNTINIDSIKYIQPGQYNRRKYAGWRILVVQIMTLGMLDFRGLGIMEQSVKADLFIGLKNMKGTFLRMLRLIILSR